MLVCTNFLMKFAGKYNIVELYLYHKLRYHALWHGGWFTTFKFTNNEKYTILPKLIELGWCTQHKVISYRKVVTQHCSTLVMTQCKLKDLITLNSFKSFTLAVAENCLLQEEFRKQHNAREYYQRNNPYNQRRWNNNGKKFVIKKSTDGKFSGRVANSCIAQFLGLSMSTVSRWRKASCNGNSYDYSQLAFDEHEHCGDLEVYYSSFKEKWIHKDLVITTNYPLFLFFTCRSWSKTFGSTGRPELSRQKRGKHGNSLDTGESTIQKHTFQL